VNNKNKKRCVYHFILFAVVACSLLIAASGCEDAAAQKFSPGDRIQQLKEEKRQLQSQIEQTRVENEQLKKQVQFLSELPADVRLENIYNLKKIKLTRFTGLFDKDKSGQYDKLIVYIQPIDEDEDIVKAAGIVDVQLWDLSKPNGQAMLGQWSVEPDQLKELWFATLVTTNYRLTFDITDKIDEFDEPLTVKVTFTDYLSGRVFKQQRVIKPR